MKALSSMATRRVLAEMLDAGFAAGLGEVELESVGGVDAARRVGQGEVVDLVFLAEGALARLVDTGDVLASTVKPLLLSHVAVAVPARATEPAAESRNAAFADADGLRNALRSASRIGYSTGPSGTALLELIDQWGMTPELADRLLQAQPGVPVAHSLMSEEVDLGFQQYSELIGEHGVRILGRMPDDCAITTVFAGAVASTSAQREAAQGLLGFLASPAQLLMAERHGFSGPDSAQRSFSD